MRRQDRVGRNSGRELVGPANDRCRIAGSSRTTPLYEKVIVTGWFPPTPTVSENDGNEPGISRGEPVQPERSRTSRPEAHGGASADLASLHHEGRLAGNRSGNPHGSQWRPRRSLDKIPSAKVAGQRRSFGSKGLSRLDRTCPRLSPAFKVDAVCDRGARLRLQNACGHRPGSGWRKPWKLASSLRPCWRWTGKNPRGRISSS